MSFAIAAQQLIVAVATAHRMNLCSCVLVSGTACRIGAAALLLMSQTTAVERCITPCRVMASMPSALSGAPTARRMPRSRWHGIFS
jgi:hypothetical protein